MGGRSTYSGEPIGRSAAYAGPAMQPAKTAHLMMSFFIVFSPDRC
jgi:hypothetical protein